MTDLRTIENDSIRAFVQSAADEGYLSGRVLDYGCGKQPYRDIVETAGGEYEGFDRAEFGGNVSGGDIGFLDASNWMWGFDAILCTQVVQYVVDVPALLKRVWDALAAMDADARYLVLTYPTNWPEVEPEDLHRFTKAGMERLLTEAGFTIIRHETRGFIYADLPAKRQHHRSDAFALGYGVICRA